VLASSKSGSDIGSLLHGYQLCAATEGKSPNTLAIVTNSVTYLYDFLSSNGLSTDVTQIGAGEMRTFILYLQQKRCFSNHPYSKAQQRGLSGHTINTYMRSIRAFWSWLIEEEVIESNPFSKVKIPKPPKKIMATFSPHQIELLLGVMSSSVEGYRDAVIVLTLLDTGLRVNELINLKMENVWLANWLESHVAGFQFWGGVPARLMPDNLGSGVVKADLYDPKFNRGYEELAHHYGCLIDPARAGKPRGESRFPHYG